MAKAKAAKSEKTNGAAVATPVIDPAVDAAQKLSDMLGGKAKQAASDVNVDVDLPLKKNAGARSTWKGTLSIPNPAGGILSVFAVKTYTATDEEKFERHMYHSADCMNPVKQGDHVCSGCGEKLNKSAAVKGSEVNGKIVLISDDEVAKLQVQNEKSMKITEYIDEIEIDPTYYNGSDFVAPDKGGETAFSMLVATLRHTGLVAKGVRVSRGKEQYFVLRPFGQHGLEMLYLRAEYEVRNANGLWLPMAVNPEMVELFSKLTESMKKPFTAAKQDSYIANCKKLAAAKATGETVDCPTPEKEAAASTDDLLAQLKATLAAAGM